VRFGLRSLFFVMAAVALVCGGYKWLREQYYVEARTVNAVLAEHPEIDRVWFSTNDDVTLEVEQVYFSLRDQPGLTFCADGIDGVSETEFRQQLERALREQRPVPRPPQFPKSP
jgi:hypothetical protein